MRNPLREADPMWRLMAAVPLIGAYGAALVALAHGHSYWGGLALVGIALLAAAFITLIWPLNTVSVPCVECGTREQVDIMVAAAHERWRCADCWLEHIK